MLEGTPKTNTTERVWGGKRGTHLSKQWYNGVKTYESRTRSKKGGISIYGVLQDTKKQGGTRDDSTKKLTLPGGEKQVATLWARGAINASQTFSHDCYIVPGGGEGKGY